ncbi:MAG: peptidoglycan DD-metalloendopeptidase family protein [Pseudomonadales bacterium]
MKYKSFVLLFLMAALAACSHNARKVPVEEYSKGSEKSSEYTVRKGDTLYAVSWRYGMEFKRLAAANKIGSPYTIFPGQRLYIPGSKEYVASSTSKSKPARTTATSSAKKTATPKPVVIHSVDSGITKTNNESWRWPTKGTVARRYSASGNVHKGVDINGKLGQSITAAKSGKVVYAGDGLKAYGLLIIVKHDEKYLSAYAYNQKVYVKEGDFVKAGQKIATMGKKNGNQAMLHFEVRLEGKPGDPLRYLPK